jgi:hypothetical protein
VVASVGTLPSRCRAIVENPCEFSMLSRISHTRDQALLNPSPDLFEQRVVRELWEVNSDWLCGLARE